MNRDMDTTQNVNGDYNARYDNQETAPVAPRPQIIITPPGVEKGRAGGSRGGKSFVPIVVVMVLLLVIAGAVYVLGSAGESLGQRSHQTEPVAESSAMPEPITEAATAADSGAQSTAPAQSDVRESDEAAESVVIEYAITASCNEGGTVSPGGTLTVAEGGYITCVITPWDGYMLSGLYIDGTAVDLTDSYTFTDVHAGHSLYAEFLYVQTGTPQPDNTPIPDPMPTAEAQPEETPQPEEPAQPLAPADLSPESEETVIDVLP